MYKYIVIRTILYQHIPVCTSTYLYVQIWPFLSEVLGFQMREIWIHWQKDRNIQGYPRISKDIPCISVK